MKKILDHRRLRCWAEHIAVLAFLFLFLWLSGGFGK